MIELLTDEEAFIVVEAIDTATQILECFTEEQVINHYLANFYRILDCNVETILVRLCQLVGKAFFKMQKLSQSLLESTHINNLMEFFKEQLVSSTFEMRKAAVFNLPCIC